ncbi:MAG: PQQ-binding-like beta-propeller repeat protein, partial [bacterium]
TLNAFVVAWRVQMAAKPNRPCAFAEGRIVTDAAGGVAALSSEGRRVWQTGFSNQVFTCAAAAVGGLAVVASQQGGVAGLKAATGEVVWTRKTGGRFQHAPLTGVRSGEPVIWLMSQEDGRLFCLRASDGGVLWQSEATNRCDGEPAVCQGRIAYGNCDGALYVFDAENGTLRGSVVVGPDDQMAGGVLATVDGRWVVGTRSGNLVVVNAATLTCEARVNLSSSEAFVKPVEAFGGLIAMGTQEGEVVFWRAGAAAVKRVAVGAVVSGLLFDAGRLYVVAGGGLSVFESADRLTVRLALGDDVGGPVSGHPGALACVADQAVVCVRGGGR